MGLIRTSSTDPIRVDWLPGHPVGMTFAPGKCAVSTTGGSWARRLPEDLARLAEVERVDVLVCLLEEYELRRLQIPNLCAQAERRGIRVLRLPIQDGGVPDRACDVRALLQSMREAVAARRRIAIHCAGGLGRTGTIAGCYLVDQGLPAGVALEMLVATRGPRCPETRAQADYIRGWARTRRRRLSA